MSASKVRNPLTGKMITVGGPTHKLLTKNGTFAAEKKRKAPASKGWHDAAPKKGAERHEMRKKCGDTCFLVPDSEGFPICAAHPKMTCEVDPRGLAAAKSRAHQFKHTELYDEIEKRTNSRKRRKS